MNRKNLKLRKQISYKKMNFGTIFAPNFIYYKTYLIYYKM